MSIWNSPTLEDAQEKFEEMVEASKVNVFASEHVMAIGGPDNFRNDLYWNYKGSRKTKKSTKPDYFEELKYWSVESDDCCIRTDNYEADDQVRIWALEAKAAGISSCVVTVDKDLDCIPGPHYNPRTKKIYQVTEEWAEYFYHLQLLMGDPVDSIPGVEGIGPKKAEGMLKGLDNRKDYLDKVCQVYYKKYGEDGFNNMLMNGKLLHIWRTFEDHYTLDREAYDAAIKG